MEVDMRISRIEIMGNALKRKCTKSSSKKSLIKCGIIDDNGDIKEPYKHTFIKKGD
jgi:hypothetical protein